MLTEALEALPEALPEAPPEVGSALARMQQHGFALKSRVAVLRNYNVRVSGHTHQNQGPCTTA